MAHMIACRLCSTTEHILDVFHSQLDDGEQLRYSILLATGIHIKETDPISTMVCHRCCEIALKLLKYRTNAVANDKLLKRKAGQPYTPPIVKQDELLLAASEILSNAKCRDDSLQLLNVSIKNEILIVEPNDEDAQLLKKEPSSLFSSDLAGIDVGVRSGKPISTTTESVCTDDKLVGSATMNVSQHLTSKLPNIQTVEQSNICSAEHKTIPNVKYKHPSVHKLSTVYENIVLPENAFTSDVSPVVSLDSSEVSSWYAEQIRTLEQKLPNINIKKVLSASCPSSSTKASAITSSNRSAISEGDIPKPCSEIYRVKRTNYRNDSDSDTRNGKAYGPFNNHQNQNLIAKDSESDNKNSEAYGPSNSCQKNNLITKDSESDNRNGEAYGPSNSHQENNLVTKDSDSDDKNCEAYGPLNSHQMENLITKDSESDNKNREACGPSNSRQKMNLITEDSDSDNINREAYGPFNGHQKENSVTKISSMPTEVPLINQQETVTPTNINPNNAGIRKSSTRKRSVFLENDDANEIVPKKMTKSNHATNTVSTYNMPDFPRECPSDKSDHITLRSLLNSAPTLPILTANSSTDTFLCRSCNKLYDTEMELITHAKIHLRCRFCRKKMKNVELLNKHQNETCFENIINNQPRIELTKIDSDPSIVKKYANAFRPPDVQKPTAPTVAFNSNEYIDYSELGLNMEKPETPLPPTELSIELEESIVNQYFTLLEDFEKNTTKALVNEDSQQSDVICISDGSDSESDLISANTAVSSAPQKIGNQLLSPLNKQIHTPKIKSTLSFQNNLSESDNIHIMFKKHYSQLLKTRENGSQTYVFSNRNVKFVSKDNHIKLCSLFYELLDYKIPVTLKSQSNVVNVELKSVPVSETRTINYSWAYKRAVGLEKGCRELKQLLDQKIRVPNHNPPPQIPAVRRDVLPSSTSYYSYTMDKISNSGYPAPTPPIHNFNNQLAGALSDNDNSRCDAFEKRHIAFKPSVTLPDTASVASSSYRTIFPVNKTSGILGNNQDHIFNDQPEQLFYNNQNVNVNNYFMLPNDIQQTRHQSFDISSGISYSNNVNTISPPSYDEHVQKYNFAITDQNVKLNTPSTNAQLAEIAAPSNMLRVKKIQDLS